MQKIHNEDGQTLILFVVMLTAIMLFVGFIINVGMLSHDKSQLDAAAALAAESGAQSAGCDTAAVQTSFSGTMPGGSISVASSGSGCSVTVTKSFPVFFNGLFDLSPTVMMHATATSG